MVVEKACPSEFTSYFEVQYKLFTIFISIFYFIYIVTSCTLYLSAVTIVISGKIEIKSVQQSNKTKKKVTWADDTKLVACQYFVIDPTERGLFVLDIL